MQVSYQYQTRKMAVLDRTELLVSDICKEELFEMVHFQCVDGLNWYKNDSPP